MQLRYKRSKLLRSGIICFVLAALLVAGAYLADGHGHYHGRGAILELVLGPTLMRILTAGLGVLLFALGILIAVRAFSARPAATLHDSGIVIHTALGDRTFAWSAIDEITITEWRGTRLIDVRPKATNWVRLRRAAIAIDAIDENDATILRWFDHARGRWQEAKRALL
jgi:hypothetical protein